MSEDDRSEAAWEHARVTLSYDGARSWGDLVVWATDGTLREELANLDEYDAAVCRVGAAGFQLVQVTLDPEDEEGVILENLWFKRRLREE